MNTPQFSIVIPTRDRAMTLRHTLETVVNQPGSFEVVVADNCSGPGVRMVVNEFLGRHPNIKYLRSETLLPMAENWERGLAACEGDYVTVLGDDDGFVSSTLFCVRKIVAATQAEVISWDMHTYWWPDTIVYWRANRLYVTFAENRAALHNARGLLKLFFGGQIGFGSLPMIYNAFVHRNLIKRAIGERGRYFYPADMSPDIASGILNLSQVDQFVHCDRPLAVRGNSRESTGTAHWARHVGAQRRAAYRREEGKTVEATTDPALIASPNLHIQEANIKLQCMKSYFPQDLELAVDTRLVLQRVIDTLNDEPEAYEDNLADALALAVKLGVDIRNRIPAKKPLVRGLSQGPYGGAAKISGVCVNGDAAGIGNVAEAARLADAMTTSVQGFMDF